MKWALVIAGIMSAPSAAHAATQDITPMAEYCVEALVDSRPLMTSALVATTAEAVGREDADERVEFFIVPHEDLVFSRLNVSGKSACSVFLKASESGWNRASVEAHFQRFGMLTGPDCSREGQEYWFTSLKNLKGNGVTAVVDVKDGMVVEILAFETPELSRPSDCKKDDAQ